MEGTYGHHDHSEVVRIWVITPLTVHLLSHHGDGLQLQTPPFVLCVSTCSSLCLGCSLPSLPPRPADTLLIFQGPVWMSPSLGKQRSLPPSPHQSSSFQCLAELLMPSLGPRAPVIPASGSSILVGLLVFLLLNSLRPGTGFHPICISEHRARQIQWMSCLDEGGNLKALTQEWESSQAEEKLWWIELERVRVKKPSREAPHPSRLAQFHLKPSVNKPPSTGGAASCLYRLPSVWLNIPAVSAQSKCVK